MVKVIDGTYNLGDLLEPNEFGSGKVATQEDKVNIFLNTIPRIKVVSVTESTPNSSSYFTQ